ncbi:MAG: hypothetical protein LBD96_10510 [Treponema sp.]|jgi:hypothetical protein|nr:hypothetical protein [Treponema sp.]
MKIEQYSGLEGAPETDKRLIEAADTTNVLGTLEESTDAMREPDSIRNP